MEIGFVAAYLRSATLSRFQAVAAVARGPQLPFIRRLEVALQSVEGDIRCACEFGLNLNSQTADLSVPRTVSASAGPC